MSVILASKGSPWVGVYTGPFALQPVASLAAVSTISFPGIPVCAGIQWICIGFSVCLSFSWSILMRCCACFAKGFVVDVTADWLSLKI